MQLQPELSNVSLDFPTSDQTFQLNSFQFHVGLSDFKLSDFSFFQTALSNYKDPTLTPLLDKYHC